MGFFNNLFSYRQQDIGVNDDMSDMSSMQGFAKSEFGDAIDEVLTKSMRADGSKALVEDPMGVNSSVGYKAKNNSLDYETLRRMSVRNSVVSAILLTRVNQVSTFTKPARYSKNGVGFEIKLRDLQAEPDDEDKRMILSLETFLENCGYNYNPYRDDFDTLVRKLVRDSLTYDQMTMEVVPDRLGRPAEIYAVDASTIRASVDTDNDEPTATNNLYNTGDMKWVQVVDGTIQAEFTGQELAFGVRNPRTDIDIQPYGFSELEVLIHQITSHLWAEEYNSRYFSQGGTTKGILNIKGNNISKPQLDSFRRQWTSQVLGVNGAWKTPVVSVEGLEYVNVAQSNREMEYEVWMNYLINIVCAVYQIDPAEINFPNRGGSGGSSGGIGDSGVENRIKNSKDKGLRPLLRFLEDYINKHIIRKFTSNYVFVFVGLDPETEDDTLSIEKEQVRLYRTVNEIRKSHDLEPIEGGDILLDGTFTNWLMQVQAQKDMEEQESMGQPTEGEEDEELVDWNKAQDEVAENEEDVLIGNSIDDGVE